MIKTCLMALAIGLISTTSAAFPCILTFVKDSCWLDYEVNIIVSDPKDASVLTKATIPTEKSWVRQSFVCQPNQTIMYTATFSPTIWEGQDNKVYHMQKYRALPAAPKPNQKAWEVQICFPKAFAEVPFPPKATGQCRCLFDQVPVLSSI